MEKKFEAFKFINKRIENRNQILIAKNNEKEVMEYSDERILFESSNGDTSYKIIKYDDNTTTKAIIDDIPKRITCLSGKINLIIPHFDEKITLKPQDSQLIPSKTYHIIEALNASEIIVIYKHKIYYDIFNEKITEKNSIYSKL